MDGIGNFFGHEYLCHPFHATFKAHLQLCYRPERALSVPQHRHRIHWIEPTRASEGNLCEVNHVIFPVVLSRDSHDVRRETGVYNEVQNSREGTDYNRGILRRRLQILCARRDRTQVSALEVLQSVSVEGILIRRCFNE